MAHGSPGAKIGFWRRAPALLPTKPRTPFFAGFGCLAASTQRSREQEPVLFWEARGHSTGERMGIESVARCLGGTNRDGETAQRTKKGFLFCSEILRRKGSADGVQKKWKSFAEEMKPQMEQKTSWRL